jgi:serine protease Do
VAVVFADGREFKGVRYKAARDTDLAFVKIEGGPFDAAALGDSDGVRVGDWAIAVGSPFSFDQTLTVGVISAKGRKLSRGAQGGYETFLQTDAAINAGNSGGPLLNLKGEVIGVNTAIYSPTRTYAGIGFAIPINRAKELFKHLETEVTPAVSVEGGVWMGATVRELDEGEKFQLGLRGGLVVLEVAQDSPAAKAGLQEFDILLEAGGDPTPDETRLRAVLAAKKPGDRVVLKLLRGNTLLETACVLEGRD